MTQKTSPFLEAKYGWAYGESGWNTGMDENLLKFSFMFDNNIDGLVSALPPASNGKAYFLTTDNRLYFCVGTSYYSTPTPLWLIFNIKTTGQAYQFNGTSAQVVNNVSQLDNRVTALELELASLGTAAYENIDYFASQSDLDVAQSTSESYTDTLRNDLSSSALGTPGANRIGYNPASVYSVGTLGAAISDLSNSSDLDKGAALIGFDGTSLTQYFKGHAEYVVGSISELKLVNKLVHTKVFVSGYYIAGDGGGGTYFLDPSDTTSVDNMGTIIVSSDGGRWKLVTRGGVSLKQFGAKGDGTTNDTISFAAAKAWASSNLPTTLYIPKGVYVCSTLGNMAYSGLSLIGESDRQSVLKVTGSGVAFLADAFSSGSGSDPFVQACNLTNITVEGNSTTTNIFQVQGLARCSWTNVTARVAEPTAGIGFSFKGFMLSKFEKLMCSTDYSTMSTKPYEGLKLDEGRRAGVSIGNCSNNVFTACYFEGLSIGIRMLLGDQNTFIGGSPESCSVYGLVVGTGSRYNTFIGTGFENISATADISDAGQHTQFINCYSSKSIILQGRNSKVSGGFFERIEIQGGAVKNCIENVTYNHWTSGAGGYFDSGTATEWKNLYDEDSLAYKYPLKGRTTIAVASLPFTYTNNTGQYIEVIVIGGTLTGITAGRPGDSTWAKPFTSPTAHLMAPLDTLTLTGSVVPTGMSYVAHNGFQG